MGEKIDIVLPWVDGNDPIWRAEKAKYQPKNSDLNSEDRYRDWDNLHFVFRGIEEFMPWVNKIYFITYGHLPKWLNTNHPKLKIVKHEDFIPKEYLPTFGVRAIELNLHRIHSLGEKFIYFNDDLFVLKPIAKEEFFKNNLPVDMGIMDIAHDGINKHVVLNNVDLVSKHHNKHIHPSLTKRKIMMHNFTKWFNLGYGKYNFQNLLLCYFRLFTGFKINHHPQSYLKSTFTELWSIEHEMLDQTSKNRFRTNEDVNQYLFRFWQLVKGRFYPAKASWFLKKRKHGTIRSIKDAEAIAKDISSGRYKIYCINDGASKGRFTKQAMSDSDIDRSILLINKSLSEILPRKSTFEI